MRKIDAGSASSGGRISPVFASIASETCSVLRESSRSFARRGNWSVKFTDNFRTAWNELWFFPVSAEHLGMYRCAFFALSFYLFQSWEFARYAGAEPVLWYPVSFFVFLPQPASPETLEVLAMVWKASLVTSALGFLTRLSTMIAFLLGAYLIGLTHCYGLMRHSDAAFVVGLGILAFARSGDGLSLDSLLGLW